MSPAPLKKARENDTIPLPAGIIPSVPRSEKLKIYALGGLEEIGRNCTVFECGDDIIIVDLGFQFPEEDMHGIDYIIPNIASLEGKLHNIRALIITHGHMDHLGAIPHLLGRLGNPPLYTGKLTAGMIRKRMEEVPQAPKPNFVYVHNDGTQFKLGSKFVFEPFHVNHNISDSFGCAIGTPYGLVLHTGDFKIDFTPMNDEPADLGHIALFGARGVLALLSESTNADTPGHQVSEMQVANELENLISKAEGRLIIGTFSSMLTRVQQITYAAERHGKKIVIEGYSMKTNIEIAHELGYLKIKPGTFIDTSEMNRYPDEKIIIVCTGAQGQKNAALVKIVSNEHKSIRLKTGDTVIFSSSVIPGNERTVDTLKDTIVRQGAKVINYQMMDVHAGGHGKQEDLKLMLRLTKPKYLIPNHGTLFKRMAHRDLGVEVGLPKEHIFIPENGHIVEFDEAGGHLTKHRVNTEYVMVDGLGVGDVSNVVLRDRQLLAGDGMFVIIITMDKKTATLIGSPDIISRGFIYLKESQDILHKTRLVVSKVLSAHDPSKPLMEEYLRNKIRDEVGEFLYSQTHRRPMVLPVIIEV